jgi:PAS domain S-box-containing protein
MRDQTGLEHMIWVGEQPVATSLAFGKAKLSNRIAQPVALEAEPGIIHYRFDHDEQPYYVAQVALNSGDIAAEVALNVSSIAAAQNRLVWVLVASTLTVAAMGSTLGVFLARRISQPLVRLSDAAEEFRKGDLSSPVLVDAQVHEVWQVAQALENARIELQHTLSNLEQEKAWINHLLESIVEGIMTLDQKGRITFFSEGAERITGWKRDQVLNQPCDQIFRLVETEAAFSQSIPKPGARSTLMVELTGGNQASLSITRSQLAPFDLTHAEVVLVFRDVSEEEFVHRLLGDFLANIAHEFRTPLSALAASIELLMDQVSDLSADELQELLTSLHLGALGLQTLVDNLLESASIQARRFRVSPRRTDLGQVIANSVHTMQPLLDKYHQRLSIEMPAFVPEVIADGRRVEQVLVNLLSNANKYGPPDAEIRIDVKVTQEWVRVKVADRGPGIPERQRNQVFYRFMRPGLDTDSAKVGAGLGLSVVKAIIDAHGGQVGVDEHPGGGAVFWFTLPVAREL